MALGLLAVLLAAGRARADGAFPSGQTILAPRDLPGQVLIATNFGVVRTSDAASDGGGVWLWSCEQPINAYGRLYQMGPGPAHRLFAIANSKLIVSDDLACGWQAAGGTLAGASVQDAFVDPSDGNRVVAIALEYGDGGPSYRVVVSHDGGATFEAPIFSADPGDLITGVEIAASQPDTLVMALGQGGQQAPTLARSTDGGATWVLTDLGDTLGAVQIRLLGIDRDDPDRVYLRGLGPGGDLLAVSDAASPPARVPLTFANGQMTAFVQTAAGTILTAGNQAGVPVLFRSPDAETFEAVAAPPAILSMAERDGVIYAATDTNVEAFAEATSTDEGSTWTPRLRFARIAAIAGCLAAACQDDCHARAVQGQWPDQMCAAAPPDPPDPAVDAAFTDAAFTFDAAVPPPLVDAAVRPEAAVVQVAVDGGVAHLDAGDVRIPHTAVGCSCAVSSRPGPAAGWLLLAVAAALFRRRQPRA